MNSPSPSHDAAFAAALDALGLAETQAFALAVSGGGDSMALAVLCARVLLPRGVRLKAYTVDHGLRAEARAEAEAAGKALATLGIAHEILPWTGDKPQTHVQERARGARYALLAAACRRDGFPVLLTAHQAEDQSETFWMRLAHGSGLDGLAGIAPLRALSPQLRLARPLLPFSRADLRDICRAAKIGWAEDPTNENRKYLRARLRGFENLLAAEGLTPQRLADVTQKLADARAALDDAAAEKCAACVTFYPEGYARLAVPAFAALHGEFQRRVLARLLGLIAPADYPPGQALIDRLRSDICRKDFQGRTGFGCDFSPEGPAGDVLVVREAAALPAPQPLSGAGHMVWDGRFMLHRLPQTAHESLHLQALGAAGVAALRKQAAGDKKILAALGALPGKVRAGLPSVWQGEKLLSVPHLSWHDAAAGAALSGMTATFPALGGSACAGEDCFGGA